MTVKKSDTLLDYLWTQDRLHCRILDWLHDEAVDSKEVIDEYENDQRPKCTDGSDDIIVGRHECAVALLNQIKKWKDEIAEGGL